MSIQTLWKKLEWNLNENTVIFIIIPHWNGNAILMKVSLKLFIKMMFWFQCLSCNQVLYNPVPIWYDIAYKWRHLTHWGRVMHICISKLTIIASDNGLLPGRRQAIIWTSAGILLIGPLGTNFSEILIEIRTFSFKKMFLKVSSAKWRPFCFSLNVLKWTHAQLWTHKNSISRLMGEK